MRSCSVWPTTAWGERVVALVQLRPGAGLGIDDLTDHCRAELADFKVPGQVVLVDAIVRLSTGKADLAWARAIVDRSADQRPGYRSR